MIKQVIRLVRPGLFLPCFEVEKFREEAVLIRPCYLSICAADQRYFQGNRPPEVLAQKLPLALFHEAVGEVLHDPVGELKTGTHCVLLPGGVDSLEANSNYKKDAFFRSSNEDGFCQELMYLDRRELLPVPSEPAWPYVFTELMSVCVQGIRRLERVTELCENKQIGIWGDGPMAYMMALAFSQIKPSSSIIVFGKHDDKLTSFSFAKTCVNIYSGDTESLVDIAVECVGGPIAYIAIEDAIRRLNPTGLLLLMGVSESHQNINTRAILEKGLIVIGTSRSAKVDFDYAIKLLSVESVQKSILKIFNEIYDVYSSEEMIDIFNNKKDKIVLRSCF